MKISTVQAWGYTWLKCESSDGVFTEKVWCSICAKVYGSQENEKGANLNAGQTQLCGDTLDAYVRGTDNVKKDTAKCHGSSRSHCRAEEQLKKRESSESLNSHFNKLGLAWRHRMCKLFDWAYLVAKEGLPFTMFPKLASVEVKHGSDLGNKYMNNKACRNFILAIAERMVTDLKEEFAHTPFYCSLLFDGSTDKALSEKEVVSVKVLENGEPKIKLVG